MIDWTKNREDMVLVYLRPGGRKVLTMENAMKKAQYGQLYAWITTLGQDRYEMTGVTAFHQTWNAVAPGVYTYWFKRPLL